MTSETIMLRTMRRTDFPALEELVRQAWYADDESDDNGNVPNDECGLREYKLHKAIRLRNMHRLAAIDMHDFLSRTTEATVAERDGRVLGVVLGSLRFRVTTAQRILRAAGMNEYFLFTDTTCDYGFYDYRGLTRKAERTIRRDSFTQGGLEDGSLSFFLYEGRC